MKRLLFIIPALNHGGTNKSLMNILSCLDYREYTIDIFVIAHVGPYKNIFSQDNILKRDLLLSSIFEGYRYIKTDVFSEKIKKIAIKSIFRVLYTIFGKPMLEYAYKISAKKIDMMHYDKVIAMQEGEATHFAAYVKTPKVAWIRCDYSQYIKPRTINEERIYASFNHIICVSRYTSRVFINYYPSLARKCHGIHNMIDYQNIIKMSNDLESIDSKFILDKFSIISIGRLSPVKQFDIIPEIASQLIADGRDFRWYIIGDGEERDRILNEIERYRVSDYVVLLGEKDNPYPYIKNCDLLVCTSASEACPNIINEALILHVPVVTTDFGSAPEFVDNGKNGIIANIKYIEKAINEMIQNRELYERMKININTFIYSNDKIIADISKLL